MHPGEQARKAIEVLLPSLDRAEVSEAQLYEAALTVLMRLAFLSTAEEQGLLFPGNPTYDNEYAVCTLRARLRAAADQNREELLERQIDAWPRLLATFRAIHAGAQHGRCALPAYGGLLFDPDRHPFLEDRLPISNRIVLLLLETLQSLDLEEIGHLYEGLLDYTAKRAQEAHLGLIVSQDKVYPLAELERLRARGEEELVHGLHQAAGRSKPGLKRTLAATVDDQQARRFRTACGEDSMLWERVKPFIGLVRDNPFGYPTVVPTGSLYLTESADRRTSGAHYTPSSLTEPMVRHTLEPLVYVGPAEGKPKKEWKLRPAQELLALKICDPATGSGAFLIQTCRYLSERLVEAWEETTNPTNPTNQENPSAWYEERLLLARRLVAQHCLYGVDRNPLAIEMAKLSLWLLTRAKDKPFTFLDHALRCGDALVGIHDLQQLKVFHLNGKGDQEPPLQQSEEEMARLKCAADFLIARAFEPAIEGESQVALLYDRSDLATLQREARKALGGRPTFHWPLEFPEVFGEHGGFDALVGNPPFLGGQKITGILGDAYRAYLITHLAGGKRGSADLCAYFFLRARDLVKKGGRFGFLATNTIAQGETGATGLEQLVGDGCTISQAVSSRKWPGCATVEVAQVWVQRGPWTGQVVLDGRPVAAITPRLGIPSIVAGNPYPLRANARKAFQGNIVLGTGFLVDEGKVRELLARDSRNRDVLFPYLNGKDLNSRPDQTARRWVIQFDERTEAEARTYREVWAIVEQRVKPERLTRDALRYPRMVEEWWKHWNNRRGLRGAIANLDQVVVRARVSDTHAFALVPATCVFADQVIVIALSSPGHFAVLQSEIHHGWYRRLTSSLRTDVRYSPTDCFANFPIPPDIRGVIDIGRAYHDHRRRIMLTHQLGLTKLYRRFHDRHDSSADILELRKLKVELDCAVAAAYGWLDLDLGYGIHDTRQGERFTIGEQARGKVFNRLMCLNHEWHRQEAKQPWHRSYG